MSDEEGTAAPPRPSAGPKLVAVVLGLIVGLGFGFGAGLWWADRADWEAEWCQRAETVSRAARAGAPWGEAVDEWSLARNTPDWAGEFDSYEVMYGEDPSTRQGSDSDAADQLAGVLVECRSRGHI